MSCRQIRNLQESEESCNHCPCRLRDVGAKLSSNVPAPSRNVSAARPYLPYALKGKNL